MKDLQSIMGFSNLKSELEVEARSLVQQALVQSSETKQPTLVHLCGIPGCGKSRYAKARIQSEPHLYLLAFDAVMHSLSGYQRAIKEKSLPEAFAEWELPARTIGYYIVAALIENNRSFLFDHSAAFENHVELLKYAKKKGYRLEMVEISCSPEVALRRVRARETKIQQHTPEHLIWERFELIKKLLPEYKKIVDSFQRSEPNDDE